MKVRNTFLKKIIIAIFLVFATQMLSVNVFAANTQKVANKEPVLKVAGIGEITGAAQEFINAGKDAEYSSPSDFFNDDAGLITIGQVLVAIGIAVIVIVGAILAIQWITATPDKQAKLKQQLIGYVVSIIVIFGAVGIWNFVQRIFNTALPV